MTAGRSRRAFLGTAAVGIGAVGGVAGGLVGTGVGAQQVRDSLLPEQLRRRAAARSALYVASDFGVAGDGRTDDAEALNALLAAVQRDGGGVVLLPHGTYLLGSPLILRSGVQLTSAAPNHGYVALDESASGALLKASPRFDGAFVVDTGAEIVAGGMSGIDVRGTSATGGVRIRKGSWAVVSKSHIDACGDEGLLVQAGVACVFEDLLTTNCLLNRDRDEVAGTIDLAGTDHYVTRCEANASLRARSSAAKRVAAMVLRGSNHFVSDSVGEYSDVGFVVTATYSRFSTVRADTNWGDGWQVRGAGNAFSACSATGNSQEQDGEDDGWLVSGGGNAFSACTVHTPTPGKAVRFGFHDVVDSAPATNRNTYVGCVADRARTALWRTEGFLGSSPLFPAHPIRPKDGTAQPDVSQTTLVVLFDYTTSTTITDFRGGVTGQTIRVLGSDQVTLAHSTGMRLRGGADRQLLADDVVVLTNYDGSWFESST